MENNRAKREVDTRESEAREQQWTPPEMLPTPNPEDGYEFRWIRASMFGNDDPTNLSAKQREGWVPVKASDHPELGLVTHGASKRAVNHVEYGGLILCKTPSHMVSQRNAHYNAQTKRQMESVDNNYLQGSHEQMPKFHDRRSSVTFGTGSSN